MLLPVINSILHPSKKPSESELVRLLVGSATGTQEGSWVPFEVAFALFQALSEYVQTFSQEACGKPGRLRDLIEHPQLAVSRMLSSRRHLCGDRYAPASAGSSSGCNRCASLYLTYLCPQAMESVHKVSTHSYRIPHHATFPLSLSHRLQRPLRPTPGTPLGHPSISP